MKRIIIQKLDLYSDSSYSTLVGGIENVVVETREISVEENDVEVDDGQNSTESYVVGMTIRSRNDTFTGGSEDGNSILGYTDIATQGEKVNKLYPKMVGAPNSVDLDMGGMEITGRKRFDNGRVELELSGQLEVIDLADGIDNVTATGS